MIKFEKEYRERIEVLQGYLDEEGEGQKINPASEKDFWLFIKSISLIEGDLVLTDPGNLRAIWSRSEDDHLGLSFFGGGLIQYVSFSTFPWEDIEMSDSGLYRHAGREGFEVVRKLIVSNHESILVSNGGHTASDLPLPSEEAW